MLTPLDEIKNGDQFQQIVAQYFRCLKSEGNHAFHFADIDVEDNGKGCDDGCDILVKFYFEDAIGKHSHKWIVECKSQERAVNDKNITNNLENMLDIKLANGYLLVCKNDATTKLKRYFKEWNDKGKHKYVIWNGSQLWNNCITRKSLLVAFFPKFYKENFIENNAESSYANKIKEMEKQLENKGQK